MLYGLELETIIASCLALATIVLFVLLSEETDTAILEECLGYYLYA
jgi:hypothetical protein